MDGFCSRKPGVRLLSVQFMLVHPLLSRFVRTIRLLTIEGEMPDIFFELGAEI